MSTTLTTTVAQNPISSSIDYNLDGVQHGYLKLPYSHDRSAWGSIMIPICQIKNGDGETALLTGGNHGDEYEGPVALSNLCHELQPEQIQGRVIIVPFMNYPAFCAGTRTSPIDKGNLNRLFPGSPTGTVTEKIADYFQHTLLPMADYVLDIHAGGRTLDFVPFAAVHVLEDKNQQHRCEAAMHAFAAPYSLMMLELDNVGMYDTAAEDAGKVFVSTELGGGGSSSAYSNQIAMTGCHNFLVHTGIKHGEIKPHPTMQLDMPDDDCFITSESSGLFEICCDLGDRVSRGQVLAKVHRIDKLGEAPAIYTAKRDGILVARHFPGLVAIGDCLAVVADVVS